jgi:hypothetical protein
MFSYGIINQHLFLYHRFIRRPFYETVITLDTIKVLSV